MVLVVAVIVLSSPTPPSLEKFHIFVKIPLRFPFLSLLHIEKIKEEEESIASSTDHHLCEPPNSSSIFVILGFFPSDCSEAFQVFYASWFLSNFTDCAKAALSFAKIRNQIRCRCLFELGYPTSLVDAGFFHFYSDYCYLSISSNYSPCSSFSDS